MKKLLILTILYLHFGQVFAQSVQWQREIDYAPITSIDGDNDQLLNLHLVDTNTFYSSVYTGLRSIPSRGAYYPLMFKHRASDGIIVDTITFFDTTTIAISCYNRQSNNFWFYLKKAGRLRGYVLQKINQSGRVLYYRTQPFTFEDSVTAFPSKIIPSKDGGFYIIGTQDRTFNNQQIRVWQVSRWDSTANRKWIKEYMFEYTQSVLNEAEFLPNGNLFVSGWHGPQIMALEIDTANGRMVDRKVLFTHPRNMTWGSGSIYRHPRGYFISARENVDADTSSFNGFFNLQGRPLWTRFSRNVSYGNPVAMADSTMWAIRSGSLSSNNSRYDNIDTNGTILYSVLLANGAGVSIGNAQHLTNGSAIFGGGGNDLQIGQYLYFCKIDSIGTPYNPIYPPVGPVLTSNQKQNQEPNLQVYPNPFTNTLRLSHKGTAQLLDVHGRVILSQPVEAGEELKVANLPKGMYLLRLQSVGGKLYVRKVVRD